MKKAIAAARAVFAVFFLLGAFFGQYAKVSASSRGWEVWTVQAFVYIARIGGLVWLALAIASAFSIKKGGK